MPKAPKGLVARQQPDKADTGVTPDAMFAETAFGNPPGRLQMAPNARLAWAR